MSDRLKNLLAQIPLFKKGMVRMHQQVAEFVAENLEERGWDQQDLAKEMGVDPASLSRSLSYNGTANLTLETVAKIETPFGKHIFARRAEVIDELKHDPKSLSQIVFSVFETDDRSELLERISQNSQVRNAVRLGVFDGSRTLKIERSEELQYSFGKPTKRTPSSESFRPLDSETLTIP